MTTAIPRIRMFAGPNGSGKSTIKHFLRPEHIGVYVNPDELQVALEMTGELPFERFQISVTEGELHSFFHASRLAAVAGLQESVHLLSVAGNCLRIPIDLINAYVASIVADFIRHKLLDARVSFTFETVMSSVDKVELFAKARRYGYRTYLYFIATEDPQINIARVAQRVRRGGHDVPQDKIVSRYYRTLQLLTAAIRESDRAFLFDNSGATPEWIAEVTHGTNLELRSSQVPAWFQISVLDRIRGINQ